MNSSRPAVAVCIVTHNSGDDILQSLRSLESLIYEPIEIVIVDCASQDQTLTEIERYAGRSNLQLEALDRNLGFSGGMNVAIQRTHAPWILSLNPDAEPHPGFLSELMTCIEACRDMKVGAVTGRLVRPPEPDREPLLDACGMHLTMTWRHLDRGSSQRDRGQWNTRELVFGGTGAATLFNREALEDVAIDGKYFAEEFSSYREDAELCFRLCERSWQVVYEPLAMCRHRRHNLPSRRRQMSEKANFDSLKNRFLLRAYHQDPWNFVLTLLPTLWRDLIALVYVLAFERTSLAAFAWLWRRRREILERRRQIQARKLISGAELNRWFFRRSIPL